MKLSSLAKYALTVTIGVATLAACSNSGGSSLAPSGASVGMQQSGLFSPDQFLPNKKKKKQPYQYFSNLSNGTLLEFDYPKSDASIGSISGVTAPQGECTNVLFGTGKKTFWVTSSTSGPGTIQEFKVGGTTPMATLQAPSGDTPVGCAMSTTGDLVATSITNGHVDLFKGAKGTATQLTTPLIEAFFAGYDKSGNLYVDGFNSSTFDFVELPKGSKSWETLSLSNSVEFPGSVQYDGKYITVNDQEGHAIYGYRCSSGSCTLERTVSLSGASGCGQTWIARGYVICGAEIVKYPAGGNPIAHLGTSSFEPLGAVQVEK
jgi:hypothetical protein